MVAQMSEVRLLENRRAVITCTSTPLGRAIALKFAEQGAIVAFGAPDEESGERLLGEMHNASTDSFYMVMDLSRATEIDAFCALVNERFPVVNVLVNNPYYKMRMGLLESDDENEAMLFQVYQRSIVQTQRAFLGMMLGKGRSCIVNIASSEAFTPVLCAVLSSAANAAIGGMTRIPAIEGGDNGVRANELLVSYAVNEPEMAHAPLSHIGGRRDIDCAVEATLFLASDMSSYVNGVSLNVGGGARHMI
jgi:NAD(P)-dependent dehydrogenase (short-subunit alcohol dehydrogenase family)